MAVGALKEKRALVSASVTLLLQGSLSCKLEAQEEPQDLLLELKHPLLAAHRKADLPDWMIQEKAAQRRHRKELSIPKTNKKLSIAYKYPVYKSYPLILCTNHFYENINRIIVTIYL